MGKEATKKEAVTVANREEKGLSSLQDSMIDLCIAEPGLKKVDMAERLGVHPNTISANWTESFEEALAAARQDVRRKLAALQIPALQAYKDGLDDENILIRLKVADQVLKGVNPDKVEGSLKVEFPIAPEERDV